MCGTAPLLIVNYFLTLSQSLFHLINCFVRWCSPLK
jgi:hypothetical protein